MSVVYTIKSEDCIGGALGVSNRPDGDIFYTRDMTTYTPADNSIYCINGSFSAHCAYGILRGVRFAVVLFIPTPQSMIDVVSLWNSVLLPQQICTNCYRVLPSLRKFNEHFKFICKDCGECCNTLYSLKKHVCKST
jgi:hypothetical protein